jgi:hypothetical protein
MQRDRTILEKTVSHALSGEGAHATAKNIFARLDWKAASHCPKGAPHSAFELLNHIVFWQDWVVKWLDGNRPPIPKHASGSWPGSPSPASAEDWKRAVKRFQRGLTALERGGRKADLLVKQGNKTRLEMLHAIATHNSYHLGQVVLLSQMLGAWPRPGGGLTW